VMAALAHGLPVVGTAGPCTDPLFAAESGCLLTGVPDAPALVANLDRLLRDAPSRARAGLAARATYEAHFTWERIAAAYLAALGEAS
jgi:glycosyltransferase involved in cell wall biosynthesis